MKTRRRLFIRKECPPTQTWVVGPTFKEKIQLLEVSLGGMKLVFKNSPPEPLALDIRVKIALPALPPATDNHRGTDCLDP